MYNYFTQAFEIPYIGMLDFCKFSHIQLYAHLVVATNSYPCNLSVASFNTKHISLNRDTKNFTTH